MSSQNLGSNQVQRRPRGIPRTLVTLDHNKNEQLLKLKFIKQLLAIQEQHFAMFSYMSTATQICIQQLLPQLYKTPRLTSILSGQAWIDELINNPNDVVFHQNLGMHKHVFFELRSVLEDSGILFDSRSMTSTEKLTLLLYAIITGLSNRQLQNRFQRSADSISKTINHLVKGISDNRELLEKYIPLPNAQTPLPEDFTTNKKFMPYFKDCIGAIDGTHIPVTLPASEFIPFLNRKGYTSQNVLAACNFNMEFIYLLVGAEGSMADGTLWTTARDRDLAIPAGKYYLGDAGFALTETCLVPYCKVRYHLQEWEKKAARPQNAEELFNLRHASARNVIERIFGVCKKRFKIMAHGCQYTIEIQISMVTVMCFIHNFIRSKDPNGLDEEFPQFGDDFIPNHQDSTAPVTQNQDDNLEHFGSTAEGNNRAKNFRDSIAAEMWADYVKETDRRKKVNQSRQRHGQPPMYPGI